MKVQELQELYSERKQLRREISMLEMTGDCGSSVRGLKKEVKRLTKKIDNEVDK
ncbi:hypothetical protein LCGC14_2131220 [marine sediment metagenome]|uniref:Uncharacterized protein n=1 Tax=marine sediment metagenome TaxID=412755 RepID=A0A0F9ENK6_9ZZZZ